jgi:four helix bundle protein
MGTFQSFEKIEAWQKARELTNEIYTSSNQGMFSKDFGLRDQIRRAAVSILSNIAEGFERNGTGEFIHFLSMAKGSSGEVKAQLYVARDQNYLNEETFAHLHSLATEVGRMIGGLINYLQQAGIKGTKYKTSSSNKTGESRFNSKLETRNRRTE